MAMIVVMMAMKTRMEDNERSIREQLAELPMAMRKLRSKVTANWMMAASTTGIDMQQVNEG